MYGLKSLAHSRKFWLTMAGVVGSVLVKISTGDAVTAGSVAALFLGLVQGIAREDHAEKSNVILSETDVIQ